MRLDSARGGLLFA